MRRSDASNRIMLAIFLLFQLQVGFVQPEPALQPTEFAEIHGGGYPIFPPRSDPISTLAAHTASAKPGEILVGFLPQIPERVKRQAIEVTSAEVIDEIPALNVSVLQVPETYVLETIDLLLKNEDVAWAEPNYLAHAVDTVPDDPMYTSQWGLEAIEAPRSWDFTTGSPSVTIAVLDTGVDLDHPDLADNIVSGYDFVNDDNLAQDDHGHGTSVAGVAAARGNNAIGVAGVCWTCSIMPIKVLDAGGSGSYADVAQGIIWAADHGATLINLSLGGDVPSTTLQSAVDYAHGNGLIVVAASGNDGVEGVLYPAACEHAIGVSAIDDLLDFAAFSNYGPEIDLTAPGVGIISTCLDDGYCQRSGTSMATPHVAATAALLTQSRPGATNDEIASQLGSTAVDLDPQGWDIYTGAGLIDAGLAVSLWHQTFIDVPVTHWAWMSIEALSETGITKGCRADPPMYCPGDMVTRAQMAIFMLRGLFGSDYMPPSPSGVFADVDPDGFTAPWIEDFYRSGFTAGCATDPLRYCPQVKLTRDQMAVFLVRADHGVDFIPPPASGVFSDVPLDGYFDGYIEQLYADGITSGCGSDPLRYCPHDRVSRAQMAVFLDRLFDLTLGP